MPHISACLMNRWNVSCWFVRQLSSTITKTSIAPGLASQALGVLPGSERAVSRVELPGICTTLG